MHFLVFKTVCILVKDNVAIKLKKKYHSLEYAFPYLLFPCCWRQNNYPTVQFPYFKKVEIMMSTPLDCPGNYIQLYIYCA